MKTRTSATAAIEPGKIPNPKDAVENKLHSAVCSDLIPLATAQKAIAGNWTTAFDDAGLRIAGGKVCLRDTPTQCTTSHRVDEDGNLSPTSPRDLELAGNVLRRSDGGPGEGPDRDPTPGIGEGYGGSKGPATNPSP